MTTRFIIFIVLVVFCGLIEVPIAAVVRYS